MKLTQALLQGLNPNYKKNTLPKPETLLTGLRAYQEDILAFAVSHSATPKIALNQQRQLDQLTQALEAKLNTSPKGLNIQA